MPRQVLIFDEMQTFRRDSSDIYFGSLHSPSYRSRLTPSTVVALSTNFEQPSTKLVSYNLVATVESLLCRNL